MLEAKAQGLSRYFTGKECPRGHIAERFVSTRACTACARDRKHLWNATNPDKVNAQKRAYTKANTDQVKAWKSASQKRNRASANARNRRYAATHREQLNAAGLARRLAHPEKEKARTKAWAKTHPERMAAATARRRAATLRATPGWADKAKIQKVYDLCARFRSLGCDFHVDHVIPLQGRNVCGLHVHNNLEIIEASKNRSKSNQLQGA